MLVFHWLYSCHIIDFNTQTKLCILDSILKHFCACLVWLRHNATLQQPFFLLRRSPEVSFSDFANFQEHCVHKAHRQVSNLHGHTQRVLCPYLIHKDVKDTCSYWQGQKGEEESEEPGRGVHRCMETLRTEMNVQLWQLLLITEMKTWKRYKWKKQVRWKTLDKCTSEKKQLNWFLVMTLFMYNKSVAALWTNMALLQTSWHAVYYNKRDLKSPHWKNCNNK